MEVYFERSQSMESKSGMFFESRIKLLYINFVSEKLHPVFVRFNLVRVTRLYTTNLSPERFRLLQRVHCLRFLRSSCFMKLFLDSHYTKRKHDVQNPWTSHGDLHSMVPFLSKPHGVFFVYFVCRVAFSPCITAGFPRNFSYTMTLYF